MKIRSVPSHPFTIDVKRFGLPFIVESTCPGCGLAVERDLDGDYLSYPTVGCPERIGFIHEIEEPKYRICGEWFETVVIDIIVRPERGQP